MSRRLRKVALAVHLTVSIGWVGAVLAYLGLGDTAAAMSALERANDAGEIWTSLLNVSQPFCDAIRESPRFHALLRRVGLADVLRRR